MNGGEGLAIGALTLADLAPLFEDPPEAVRARLQWPYSPFAFWLARTRPAWRIAGTGASFDEVCAVIVEANVPYELVSPSSPAADLLVLDGPCDDDAMDTDEGMGFGRWQPLLAPDATVLIHGTHAGCGGSRLWRQWRREHPVSPSFTLSAGQGLGLGTMDATSASPLILGLCALPADAAAFFEQICRSAAARWAAADREADSERRIAWLARSYVRAAERQKEGIQSAIREIEAELAVLSVAGVTAAVLSAERARAEALAELSAERERADGLAHRVAAMEASNTWRAGEALQRIPAPARRILRGAAQLIWWTVTGQLVQRLRARRASLRAASDSGTNR